MDPCHGREEPRQQDIAYLKAFSSRRLLILAGGAKAGADDFNIAVMLMAANEFNMQYKFQEYSHHAVFVLPSEITRGYDRIE